MKKTILFSLLVLLNFPKLFSQSWEWSKKISSTYEYLSPYYYALGGGLFSAKNGNIYTYSSRYGYSNWSYSSYAAEDTLGSILKCFDDKGNLLFTKRWAMPFFISKMDYDGENNIYFSAVFCGNQTINGINIKSSGKSDGVVGKMALDGTILWISAFGGSGEDECLGVSYDKANQTVYASGSIQDSLYFNNVFTDAGEQSGIVCAYNSSGKLLQHKLYDYVPNRDNYKNCGLEISCNDKGDLYVLFDRDGKHWNGSDSVSAPEMGRYVTKINPSLDTLWSKFIIGPRSYYGFSCNTLKTAASGDAYIISYGSGKYGGSAAISKLKAADGSRSVINTNGDGYFRDIILDGNKLYVIGTEGANYCPCPGSNSGYQVIKIFDENNVLLGETRSNAGFSYITKGSNNGLYVTGAFSKPTCSLGPDLLTADSTLSPYSNPSDKYYNYNGHFLSRLKDITCTAPVVTTNVQSVYGYYYSLCPGDTAVLTNSCSSGTFLWSNGAVSPASSTSVTGSYSVINMQPNGCAAYSLPIRIVVNENDHSHKICQVSFDNGLGKNRIIIRDDNYEQAYDISEIDLYKEVNGTAMLLRKIDGKTFSTADPIIDESSDPATGAVSYFIKTIDTCGTTSPMSAVHTTMMLNKAVDGSGKEILNWTPYSGFAVRKYFIWKGTTPSNLKLYDSVSKMTNSYTDQVLTASSYYQIEAQMPYYEGCYNTGFYFRSSKSNIAAPAAAALSANDIRDEPLIDIYPNPASNTFTIHCNGMKAASLSIKVNNELGASVFYENIKSFNGDYIKTFDAGSQPKGMYFLEIGMDNRKFNKKIILQ